MDDILTDDALKTATSRLMERYQKRLAREMLGATLAGYAALDVIRQPQAPMGDPEQALADALTIQAAFIPQDDPDAAFLKDVRVERYVLDDLGADDIDQLRRIADGDAWGEADA